MMIILEHVVCKICEKVFCCSECREQHELKTHSILVQRVEKPNLRLFCPICQKEPLILHEIMHTELLEHISKNHLPLNCRKCSKVYTKFEDFSDFSKCTLNNVACNLEVTSIVKTERIHPQDFKSNVSTQTSPMVVSETIDSHITPISMINVRWKAKSKITEEFISDSSSIKNISSINNSSIRKSLGVGPPVTKGKLVRSTSTPLQSEMIMKLKQPAFNVSGAHVSSIYNSASETEENSPPLAAPSSTPSTRPMEAINRYQKTRCRAKMSVGITPLRQVMSKSIQKAIAEHEMEKATRGIQINKKKMFDSIDSTGDLAEKSRDSLTEKSTENYPLDLRLSPALRRTQSEIIDRKSHLEFLSNFTKAPPETICRLLSSTRKTTESIVITSSTAESVTEHPKKGNRSGGSVYQTCRSVEIVTSTSTELSEVNIKENEIVYENCAPPITPRIPNSEVIINKKIINFETPVIKESIIEKRSPDEQFFTPSSTPVRNSKINRKYDQNSSDNLSKKFYSMEDQEYDKSEATSDFTDIALEDDVFVEEKKPEKSGSKLWSLVASMIRLPSFNAAEETVKIKHNRQCDVNSSSLIKKCASFAGSLVKTKSTADDCGPTLKRKRNFTTDSQQSGFSKTNCIDFDNYSSESKRFRINGRMPIQRMRCNY